jgi:predicted GNAT family acetyltransferase
MSKDAVEVQRNEAAQRYETVVEGSPAIIQYEQDGDRIVFLHTEVPEALEGRGIGSALARAALEDARDRNLTVVPRCPFVRAYIRRHPEYETLLDAVS